MQFFHLVLLPSFDSSYTGEIYVNVFSVLLPYFTEAPFLDHSTCYFSILPNRITTFLYYLMGSPLCTPPGGAIHIGQTVNYVSWSWEQCCSTLVPVTAHYVTVFCMHSPHSLCCDFIIFFLSPDRTLDLVCLCKWSHRSKLTISLHFSVITH